MVITVNQKLLSQSKNIEITYKRNDDKSVDISYTKKLPGSYYIDMEYEVKNISSVRIQIIDKTKKEKGWFGKSEQNGFGNIYDKLNKI